MICALGECHGQTAPSGILPYRDGRRNGDHANSLQHKHDLHNSAHSQQSQDRQNRQHQGRRSRVIPAAISRRPLNDPRGTVAPRGQGE